MQQVYPKQPVLDSLMHIAFTSGSGCHFGVKVIIPIKEVRDQ